MYARFPNALIACTCQHAVAIGAAVESSKAMRNTALPICLAQLQASVTHYVFVTQASEVPARGRPAPALCPEHVMLLRSLKWWLAEEQHSSCHATRLHRDPNRLVG
jgi:hypothetical protein